MRIIYENNHEPAQGKYKDAVVEDGPSNLRYFYDDCGSYTIIAIPDLSREAVGLGNVNNTSDANKPISIATQVALDKKTDSVPVINSLKTKVANQPGQLVRVLANNSTLPQYGGAFFYWDETSTATDDGATVVKVTSVTTGRWLVLNKDELSVFNFGVVSYSNVSNPNASLYISNANLIAYFAFCAANKMKAKFPAGAYQLQDGNYTLPDAGLVGEGKRSTTIYCASDQTGILFTYNTVGDYVNGHGEPLEAVTVRTISNSRQQASLFKISTPSRGTVLRDVNFYSDGIIVDVDDCYYLNFDNCGFFGTYRANFTNITLEADKFTGIGLKTGTTETNNVTFHKCDFKDLKNFIIGQGDPFKGSNTILFTNTAFERVGDVGFDIRGWNATFLTCYLERLDLHKNFKVGATSEYDQTVVALTGAGVVQFIGQTIINMSGSRSTDATVCVFDSILDVVSLTAVYMALPSPYAGRINHQKTYSAMSGIHWGGLVPTPIVGYVAPNRHSSQANTNKLRSSRVEQSGHPFVSVEKMGTNYKSLVSYPDLVYINTNSRALNAVDGRIYDKPILVHIKGRQYRIGSVTDKTQWIAIDGLFRIDPTAPSTAVKVSLTVSLEGTAAATTADSFFGATDPATVASRISMWRLSDARTGDLTTAYHYAYQIGLTGETATGDGSEGFYMANDLEIQVIHAAPTAVQVSYNGIYSQSPHFVANP